jgi:hypothetical protein
MPPEFDSGRVQTGFHRAFRRSKDACDLGKTETFQVAKIQNHLRAGRQPAEDVVDVAGPLVLSMFGAYRRQVLRLDLG